MQVFQKQKIEITDGNQGIKFLLQATSNTANDLTDHSTYRTCHQVHHDSYNT